MRNFNLIILMGMFSISSMGYAGDNFVISAKQDDKPLCNHGLFQNDCNPNTTEYICSSCYLGNTCEGISSSAICEPRTIYRCDGCIVQKIDKNKINNISRYDF